MAEGSVTERQKKILAAMYELSAGSTRACRYEDIVVKAFEMYPRDFQLRGHPQYPDSSDVHKPLYGPLKRKGLIKAAEKTFSLTKSGLSLAERVAAPRRGSSTTAIRHADRLTRDQQAEVARIKRSAAWSLFAQGKQQEILDTDFLSYLGVSVRTPRNDFIGRLTTVASAVAALHEERLDPTAPGMVELYEFLRQRFKSDITAMSGGRDAVQD